MNRVFLKLLAAMLSLGALALAPLHADDAADHRRVLAVLAYLRG